MTRPNLPLKLYYRIGEVADIVGVETHVLRYWESEFPTIRPQKSPKGQRVYSRRDLEKLLRVKELLYSEGYTVQGARKRLRELSRESEPKAVEPSRSRAEEPKKGIIAETAATKTRSPLEPFHRQLELRTVLETLRSSITEELASLAPAP